MSTASQRQSKLTWFDVSVVAIFSLGRQREKDEMRRYKEGYLRWKQTINDKRKEKSDGFPCEEWKNTAKWWEIKDESFKLLAGRRRFSFYPLHINSQPCVSAKGYTGLEPNIQHNCVPNHIFHLVYKNCLSIDEESCTVKTIHPKNDIWLITRNWLKSTAQAKQMLAGG